MFKRHYKWPKWLQVITVFLPLFVTAGVANAEDESLRIRVIGGQDDPAGHLKLFNDRLKAIVGSADLSAVFIECLNCAELDKPLPTVKKLTYYILQARPSDLHAFTRAWIDTQARKPSATFEIQTDAVPPPGGLCENKPQPCYPRAFCVSMGGCSRNKSPLPCSVCN